MFRLFPKDWQDWLRAFVFPFQTYVILAPASYCYVLSIWTRHGGVRPLDDFGHQLSIGFFLCLIVLAAAGFQQKTSGHRISAYVNLGLAVLSLLFICLTPNWIQL
jgi:DMSO/TMAO reductase YedYZ heme-binding membrane subunit